MIPDGKVPHQFTSPVKPVFKCTNNQFCTS